MVDFNIEEQKFLLLPLDVDQPQQQHQDLLLANFEQPQNNACCFPPPLLPHLDKLHHPFLPPFHPITTGDTAVLDLDLPMTLVGANPRPLLPPNFGGTTAFNKEYAVGAVAAASGSPPPPNCMGNAMGLRQQPICQQQQRSTTTAAGNSLPICGGCGQEIRDPQMLRVHRRQEESGGGGNENSILVENGSSGTADRESDDDALWHGQCLRCAECDKLLFDSCFVRDGRVFCREDHGKLFGAGRSDRTLSHGCSRCAIPIGANELVYRSIGHVYHLHCFQCTCCGQPLVKGDQYLNAEGQLIHERCLRDFNLIQLHQQLTNAASNAGGGCSENFTTSTQQIIEPPQPRFTALPHFAELDFSLQRLNFHHIHHNDRSKKLPKRPRTILNGTQRKEFKLAFDRGPKPSRKVREQLAKDTGLSVRVVQVWFQNQRAKMKKERKREMDKQQQQQVIGTPEEHSPSGSGPFSNSNAMDSDGCSKSTIEDRERSLTANASSPGGKSEMMADEDSSADGNDVDGEEGEGSSVFCHSSTELPGHGRGDNLQGENTFLGMTNQQMMPTTTGGGGQQQNAIEKLYSMHHTYFAFV